MFTILDLAEGRLKASGRCVRSHAWHGSGSVNRYGIVASSAIVIFVSLGVMLPE
jgi:hypothetical protein